MGLRKPFTWLMTVMLASSALLSGCTELMCLPNCQAHQRNASSLVAFLYPTGQMPPPQTQIPRLPVPLRVGLAFLPPSGGEELQGLDEAHKEALLERIRQRFASRRFIADIVIIPDYYLTGRRGYDGLQGVQHLYGLDLMALVSYDQVTHLDDNEWTWTYLTIVGAYVVRGSRHEVSTLVDLAVVDPATRSLVIRAGGTDTRNGTATFIQSERRTRAADSAGYDAAADQMIEQFDAALTKFEADVRSGKAAVQVVSKNVPGQSGGGGALGWPFIVTLLLLVSSRLRLEGMRA